MGGGRGRGQGGCERRIEVFVKILSIIDTQFQLCPLCI